LELRLRLLDDGADILDTRKDGGEGLEVGLGFRGDQSGEGGLPRTGRSPEDHGNEAVRSYGMAQEAVFPQ